LVAEPTANTVITAATPMIIPKLVSAARILLAKIAFKEILKMAQKLSHILFHLIAHFLTVFELD